MKKTIIALMALVGVASGVEQYDILYTGDSLGTKITFDTNYTASSVAFTIDVAKLKECMGETWHAGIQASVTSLMKMTGTWDADDTKTGWVGINVNGSSTQKYGTFYGQFDIAPSVKNQTALKLEGLSENTNVKFTDSFDWDSYESMSIVLTHEAGKLTAYYTAQPTTGSLVTLTGSGAVNHAAGDITYNKLTVNGLDLTGGAGYNIVTAVAVYDSVLSASDAASVGAMMLNPLSVPEPTTATLSLLALAGLAARRRRK